MVSSAGMVAERKPAPDELKSVECLCLVIKHHFPLEPRAVKLPGLSHDAGGNNLYNIRDFNVNHKEQMFL